MIGSAQQAAADSVEHDLDRVKRQARTQANAPGMPHPLGRRNSNLQVMGCNDFLGLYHPFCRRNALFFCCCLTLRSEGTTDGWMDSSHGG